MSVAQPLRLVALDEEDLAIVSAHVQDAVLKVGDLAWRPREKRFALAMNRFDWETAASGERNHGFARRRTVLHFDRVLNVKSCSLKQNEPGAVLELLAVSFETLDPPAGLVTLYFAGGAKIRLEVEVIEARMTDLGAAWATKAMPVHDLTDIPEIQTA